MEIINTKDMPQVASFNAIVYGAGGVGKTTMASTFPKPLLLDFENGAKYFKSRGIELDTIQMRKWFNDQDKKELSKIIDNYETIIIDPIGTAMQLLIDDKELIRGTKYRQAGSGDLTMAGWGEAKNQFRKFVQWLLGTGKNIILVAHIMEDKDESTGAIIKRPLIPTGLKDELITMVDVVAYFGNTIKKDDDGNEKIVRYLDMRTGLNHISKDRTGKLGGGFVKPEWAEIEKLLKQVDKEKKEDKKQEEKKDNKKEDGKKNK